MRRRRSAKRLGKPRTIADRLAGEAAERAARFRGFFEKKFDKTLEIVMDSVREIDVLLYKDAIRGHLGDEEIALAGAFFGEALRASFGGTYERDKRRGAIALNVGGIRTYPMLRVQRAVADMRKNGVPADAFTLKNAGPLEGYVYNLGRRISRAGDRKKNGAK